MNDYIAGYLGGAGIIAALRRRAAEGGSYHVHVNLARAAMWYASLGTFQSTDFEVGDENRMIEPEDDPLRFTVWRGPSPGSPGPVVEDPGTLAGAAIDRPRLRSSDMAEGLTSGGR